jgi:HSP20 family molecular chaperone IbpA
MSNPTSHSLRSHDVTIVPNVHNPTEVSLSWRSTEKPTFDSVDHTYNPHKLGPLKELLKVNLMESSTEYYLAADLPGIKKECVEIGIEDECIVIRAERKPTETDHRVRYHKMERNNGKLERFISIPHDADLTAIVADFSFGHLEITIPKRTSAIGPVRIPIHFA